MLPKKSLDKMRAVMHERREALLRSLRREIESFHASDVSDSGDSASEAEFTNVNSVVAEYESRELTAIRDALARIDDGTYGICEDCESPIPLARLEALPFTPTCVKCQATSERK